MDSKELPGKHVVQGIRFVFLVLTWDSLASSFLFELLRPVLDSNLQFSHDYFGTETEKTMFKDKIPATEKF